MRRLSLIMSLDAWCGKDICFHCCLSLPSPLTYNIYEYYRYAIALYGNTWNTRMVCTFLFMERKLRDIFVTSRLSNLLLRPPHCLPFPIIDAEENSSPSCILFPFSRVTVRSMGDLRIIVQNCTRRPFSNGTSSYLYISICWRSMHLLTELVQNYAHFKSTRCSKSVVNEGRGNVHRVSVHVTSE